MQAAEASGLTALRRFAGDLDMASGPVVVPNGLRFCVVRECEAFDVKHHALFLRWDVFVLIEGCSLHGKVLIEDGPMVELRRNPYLVLHGEQLDPDFVGTLRDGLLQKAPPQQPVRTRRRASTGAPKSKSRTKAAAGEQERRLKIRGSIDNAWHPGG
eukprot:TRINITY_DN110842_c0_g1_i1.p1 TRINITY_DN110842_c0_g1~~TRINITY_DN110842_c0_g1_i1.p1  ORF type:complete len:166 (+),score=34.48 TRINITY_DN110842_c0_g1_i1:30-500(+)